MLIDRRRTLRLRISGPAKIQAHAGTLPRDCWVSDVSDGGVRLHAEHVEIPAEFVLILTGAQPRQCRVVWRLGCEVGAEFIDARQDGFARRMAASAPR